MKVEIRQFKPEVRAEGDQRKISGYPIVFNSLSENLGGFRELIKPGAIQWADDTKADFDHDSKYILGSQSNGTLSITEDERGVRMDVIPPDTQWARDLMVSVDRGDISQGSFAFRVLPGGQSWSEKDGETVRTLTSILVSRVSVVSQPAYSETSLQLRSAEEILADRPDTSERQTTAGQLAPPANNGGGVDLGLLRRKLELAYYSVL